MSRGFYRCNAVADTFHVQGCKYARKAEKHVLVVGVDSQSCLIIGNSFWESSQMRTSGAQQAERFGRLGIQPPGDFSLPESLLVLACAAEIRSQQAVGERT